jgi:hypothetical protein
VTAIFKKLNYKDQDPILVMGAPGSFEEELRAMTAAAKVHTAPQPGTIGP